jgi:prepilin-type N-terminal cleavage/methylation domain-containing protein
VLIFSAYRRTKRAAFTLVELLVVMAALVVLAAVTLPSVKGLLSDQKVTAAARMVKAHVEAAQARAIGSGRPVAVILERNLNNPLDPNTVTRLSIGQVFPPYEGDMVGSLGMLADSNGDGFIDQITIPASTATLLTLTPPMFGPGDFIQLDDRQNMYLIESVAQGGGQAVVHFRNPHFETGAPTATQEAQLPLRANLSARFRMVRKPTKSFLQTTVLPRGTCVDLSVSGMGQMGAEFSSASSTAPVMIVFNPQGGIAYLTDGSTSFPAVPTGVIHLLLGRTEQVSLANPLSVKDPDNSGTFNANLNDSSNIWLSANPFTGAIYVSGVQTGGELTSLPGRLQLARLFATNAITQSEN